ncbi:MAG: helix-turn-helix domain-containing protein [Thermomicrobiales bacterium]|nr:helix-turn-helix domain-containing protein [Thermomicrobiales bacterium]MCO5224833.1 helix-turn-helix domain-containing protein [Thermomicrobiales bacterium]MCO5227647.1 helix-turn-helix domain-containing protein [Thermomicrobiales bacterium]
MDHTPTHQDRLSVAETAKALDRSTEQVRRYLREGRLPGQRIGGQWFIEASAVREFGANQTKEDPFLKTLRTASRSKPLDAVIGIGSGPGSDIVNGIASYRADSVRRNRGILR